jgi:hypothetical protein
MHEISIGLMIIFVFIHATTKMQKCMGCHPNDGNGCVLFQGGSSLHPNEVSESKHMRSIHDDLPLEASGEKCDHVFLHATPSTMQNV